MLLTADELQKERSPLGPVVLDLKHFILRSNSNSSRLCLFLGISNCSIGHWKISVIFLWLNCCVFNKSVLCRSMLSFVWEVESLWWDPTTPTDESTRKSVKFMCMEPQKLFTCIIEAALRLLCHLLWPLPSWYTPSCLWMWALGKDSPAPVMLPWPPKAQLGLTTTAFLQGFPTTLALGSQWFSDVEEWDDTISVSWLMQFPNSTE